MKISLEWLREYVDYQGSPEKLEELFNDIGFSIEDRRQVGDDWMFDVEVTSNRPDCLGHIGLAREVAAATGDAFRMPDVDFGETGKDVNQWTSVANEATDLCARYTARIIDDVKIGPSPDWMVRRLETVGMRGISSVVDITNYVLMEVSQPLHSFDYDRLAEGRIVVRRARPGEQMVTIDQSSVELNNNMLVIADAAEPVALAGLMGGLASEVSDKTRTVLLESAHFDPLCIRSTSRAISLGTEASYRFERNVDIVTVEWASRRAAALLAQLAGGRIAPGVVDAGIRIPPPKTIPLRLSRLKTLLGIDVDSDEVITILQRLGLAPQFDQQRKIISCTAPSWRGDLTREIDLIEEVIRIHGYKNIPIESKIHLTVKTPDRYQRTCQKVTNTLNGCGLYETISVSFVEDGFWQPFMEPGFDPVRVLDMSRKTNNVLRPTLLPSLMAARQRNQYAGNEGCDLYELAAVHVPNPQGGLAQEKIMLAALTDGDFRQLRGVLETVVASVDKNARLSCQPHPVRWAARDTGAQLLIDDTVIGWAGKADPEIIRIFDLNQDVCLAEVIIEKLVEIEQSASQIKPLMRFPGVTRDLSLVLDEPVSWAQIEQEINDLQIDDLRQLRFVGIYRGKGISPGRKSLTLSLLYRSSDQTLTREQVDVYQEKILARLGEKFAAELRA